MDQSSVKQRSGSYGFFTVLALFAVAGAALAFFFRRQPQERPYANGQMEENPASDWQAEANIDNPAVPGVDPISPGREPH